MNTPIAYLVPRAVLESRTFTGRGAKAGVPAKTYFIPKGASVIHNFTSIHYNEMYWPDATSFKPERFMGDNKDAESAWFPFATGARQCPAR